MTAGSVMTSAGALVAGGAVGAGAFVAGGAVGAGGAFVVRGALVAGGAVGAGATVVGAHCQGTARHFLSCQPES